MQSAGPLSAAVILLLLGGCSRSSGVHAAERNPASPSAAAPSSTAVPAHASAAPPKTSVSAAAPESPDKMGPGAVASAATSAGPAASSPVRVTNIGIHVGGGPNDDETKGPIRRSVAPHLEQLGGCWQLVDHPEKAGDFGLDLRIPRDGGRAGISHPRTAIRGAGFERCVVEVFEHVEFERPRGGDTVVSYSVRFTPTR